jgi:hypothetical protein
MKATLTRGQRRVRNIAGVLTDVGVLSTGYAAWNTPGNAGWLVAAVVGFALTMLAALTVYTVRVGLVA